jgi:hypothetical protein
MTRPKASKKTRTRRSTGMGSVAARLKKPAAAQAEAAKRKFEQGVLKRAQAVREGEPLTPGTTHEIVGTDAAGKPVLKRRRFSLS